MAKSLATPVSNKLTENLCWGQTHATSYESSGMQTILGQCTPPRKSIYRTSGAYEEVTGSPEDMPVTSNKSY